MNVIIQLSTYDGNKIQQGEDNMARPTRCRRICMEPAYDSFFPDGFLTGEEVIMTLDEYETDPNQQAAAQQDTREQQKREPIRVEKTVGRNDPCPCGSGKKYKNCHGKNA